MSCSLHSNTDSATGSVSDTGFLVLEALGALVSRGAEGLEKLALLTINYDGLVYVMQSLFQDGESAYEDRPGKIFVIQGANPADDLPTIVQLEATHFAANSSFMGTPRLEFEGHLAGLTSSLLWNFDYSAHQPSVEGEDDGVRLVNLRSFSLFPCTTAEIALEQGLWVPITEDISCAFAGLGLLDRVFDLALNWMQASFTSQAERPYARHIHTRREPQRVELAGS